MAKAKKNFVEEMKAETGQADLDRKAIEAATHFATPLPPERQLVIPLENLREYASNPRGDLGDLEGLAASIRKNGVIESPTVRPLRDDLYEVVVGNRRLAASVLAGLTELTCKVRDLSDLQALELNLSEQTQHRDLTPMEEAEACRRLIELSGYTPVQVAARLGQSPSWVARRLALCNLAPEVRKLLEAGKVTLTVAQALAALPAQKIQVAALAKLGSPDEGRGAELDLEEIRSVCRPLKGAPWKLTDELLVPEAGACSACPHNSVNERMPGLFDGTKRAPMCANPGCFDGKVKAAWEKKTEKARDAGAKVLTPAEGKKLYASGTLPYSSRYVEADMPVQEDRQKRSWRQLVDELPQDVRPQLHVAQDAEGGPRELYVRDRALDAVAEHLELKWAIKASERETARATRETPEAAKAGEEARAIREAVQSEVVGAIAKKYLTEGLDLRGARLLAGVGNAPATLEAFAAATGKKANEKWLAERATVPELLALAWYSQANWTVWQEFDDEFLALAKSGGFDVEAMVRARIAGASK